MVLAATEAVCCHSTDTSTNTDAMNMRARAICETGREGKGWICCWEPLSSTSSCQPGKVARMRKQKNARIIATILQWAISKKRGEEFQKECRDSHQVRKHDTILKCTCYPNQIQWILIHAHLPCQTTGIVAAQK